MTRDHFDNAGVSLVVVTGCAAMLYNKGNPYYYKEENLKKESRYNK